MDSEFRKIVWRQFDAAIAMLENALRACPEGLWRDSLWDGAEPAGLAEFWYIAYHTLFWLDLHLSGAVEGFAPPAPFTLEELDPAGVVPARPYTQDELLSYLAQGRRKCKETLETLTDERARRPFRFTWGELSFAELMLYDMRHIQEHTAQLNLYLGQKAGWNPRWVAGASK